MTLDLSKHSNDDLVQIVASALERKPMTSEEYITDLFIIQEATEELRTRSK